MFAEYHNFKAQNQIKILILRLKIIRYINIKTVLPLLS